MDGTRGDGFGIGAGGRADDGQRALVDAFDEAVTAAWRRGWQPADVVRAVTRAVGARPARMAADAIAANLRRHAPATLDPRWPGQLDQIGARVWWPPDRTWLAARHGPAVDPDEVLGPVVAALAVVGRLPALERLGPLPGTARPPSPADVGPGGGPRPAVDDRVLSRIRALLAKAESTGYPAEAEALTAAAQERMARHSIDAAMLAAHAPGRRQPGPGGLRIGIDAPYEAPKAVLLDAVAAANRSRSVWTSDYGFCTVIGFETDLAAVETLFTSLLVQATAAMTRAGAGGGRRRSRGFRRSFLFAYATRIGERLAEVTAAQATAAAAEPGRADLLPVLASREREVDDETARLFPVIGRHTTGGVTDVEGYHSGQAAADHATLHGGQLPPP